MKRYKNVAVTTKRKLTPKQRAFVSEFMVDRNASAAARRAGYSERTAPAIGAENLRKPLIKIAIGEATEKLEEKTEITAESTLKTLREYTLICMGQKPATRSVKNEMGQLEEVETLHFDAAGAGRAIDMLMKHTGCYEKDKGQDINALFIAGVRALITPEATLPRDREKLLVDSE